MITSVPSARDFDREQIEHAADVFIAAMLGAAEVDHIGDGDAGGVGDGHAAVGQQLLRDGVLAPAWIAER
jgi:hypothetical protein